MFSPSLLLCLLGLRSVAYFFTVSSSLVSVSVEGEHLGKEEITVSVRKTT
jgi:hypothetical protein